MRFLVIMALGVGLCFVLGCSNEHCASCPDTEPVSPAGVAYSPVGYWVASVCEGMPIDDDSLQHTITLRADGSYTEFDCLESTRVVNGTYELDGSRLKLTPCDAPNCGTATWCCDLQAADMILRHHDCDLNPAWVYNRSTVN
ncbi:MAG: lipocalin family protein [candidate division Zixibacteria bacterium]|nr:lipocalin family protein [candidate division Zixibacteria bacterium]